MGSATKNCQKSGVLPKIVKKTPYLFNIFWKLAFLNRTLEKSFLNQTTNVLKFWLLQQSFLNRSFLNRDLSVPPYLYSYLWEAHHMVSQIPEFQIFCKIRLFWRKKPRKLSLSYITSKKDWMGSENGYFLMTFSSMYSNYLSTC